jgi:nucleotide-binding universal stress UspA family protein
VSKLKKVLAAIDFSECSKPALEKAAMLAARFGAELDVLHVWEAPAFAPPESIMIEGALGGRTLVDLVEKRAGHELDAFVAAHRARGIAIGRALAERGSPSVVILQTAERERCDLLVLGTHGRTGISHAVMGSVAERVVRLSPCPVLTVRGDASPHGDTIRRILAPVDYSARSRAALEYAAGLAETLGATLDVLHVWERPLYAIEEVVVRASEPPKPLGELIREDARPTVQRCSGSTLRGGTPRARVEVRIT